jgi:uncharacterized membrane protein affecting hemolysin expression
MLKSRLTLSEKRMSANIRSPEIFMLVSAVIGIVLAALLAQTRLLAFGSFPMMAIAFVVADLAVYVLMKVGVIKLPGSGA